MSKPIPTMFYVVSRAMAHAIKEGRKCDRGTMYGTFASRARAEQFQAERGLRMASAIVEK
jgi:hypothetical protein